MQIQEYCRNKQKEKGCYYCPFGITNPMYAGVLCIFHTKPSNWDMEYINRVLDTFSEKREGV